MHLRVADGLDAFEGEVAREPAQREAGAVDRRHADDALEVARLREQLHLQRPGVFLEKLFDRDGWAFHKKSGCDYDYE